MAGLQGHLAVSSWNIAAINNNPFEYWITYENEEYTKLMKDVQQFFQAPTSEQDLPLGDVFTESMYEDLENTMRNSGIADISEQDNLKKMRSFWMEDYKKRKAVSQFLTDASLGKKRLMSMPDRTTNTITAKSGDIFCRPTAINCYSKTFDSVPDFWKQWLSFMFSDPVKAAARVQAISKAKYPVVTDEEEAVSKPLSILCLALFDTALVHLLNDACPTWQETRSTLCNNLNTDKNKRIAEIIKTQYATSEIIFLQEVGVSLKSEFEDKSFKLVLPENSENSKRDQNSAILLNLGESSIFDETSVKDISEQVQHELSKNGAKVPVSDGDILFITVKNKADDMIFVLGSFHGDTNGLATVPVLRAMAEVFQLLSKDSAENAQLIIGMDANTYFKSDNVKSQNLKEFFKVVEDLGLDSNYPPESSKGDNNDYTCYNGRTFLQTQLNKAIPKEEVVAKGDVNQKDFILFSRNQFEASDFIKDNTGERKFIDDMVFPTLEFPSDHAVISAKLHAKSDDLKKGQKGEL